MKFLVDAQLPYILKSWLDAKGFDVIHTADLPEANATEDLSVIEIAENQSRIVISKDSDFLKWFILNGKPSSLLMITTGNIINRELILFFEENFEAARNLLQSHSVVELNNFFIIGHYEK